jgi:hypothetical protein
MLWGGGWGGGGQEEHEFAIAVPRINGLESREYGRRDPSRWPRDTFYQQKLALTSTTSDGHSAGIVRSRTEATEFSLV